MPYINKEDRIEYEDYVHVLAESLIKAPPGHLNYVISLLIWRLFDASPSYTKANEIQGVLTCCSNEFFRRKMAPYENNKIETNGDL